ncbi:hypothetical protein ASD15_22315 [Massilia sp. Root351]|uniref:hypothetical protein n=1 Tax=Massilia sp. Root351 TaxID=1736522 RepID=UPI00070DECC9|nr:hypothetical protein [Massilia sp. Root351]KQV78542.1 hypothetical protein ASD15_22315 [Massilia sp. Root351]
MKLITNCLRAARAALQWRLLALWTIALLLPTLALALPFWSHFSASFDHSVHAAALAQRLDLSNIADLMSDPGRNPLAMKLGAGCALLLTLLLSPLLTGAVATAARFGGTPAMRDLFAGAVAEYPRMCRMLLWAVAPLGAALGLGGALQHLAGSGADSAITPDEGQVLRIAADAIAALLFALALATLDVGRAVLAADRRRRSAVIGWWHGLRLLARRPGAMLGSYLAISLAGLAAVAALGLARIHLPHVGTAGFLWALLLTQAIAMLLAWMRAARLFALIGIINKS